MTDKLLLSIPESSRILGISTRTTHRYIALKLLPCVRIGRRKLCRTADLVQFAQHGVTSESVREQKERGAR
jgi:DNA-binding transcriptional MerR regulator